jgi:hypothetical protein
MNFGEVPTTNPLLLALLFSFFPPHFSQFVGSSFVSRPGVTRKASGMTKGFAEDLKVGCVNPKTAKFVQWGAFVRARRGMGQV